MSTILDKVAGGGLLPHVYCKKVTLEKSANDSTATDVTLLLELYQDKNKLLESTWLNDLAGSNQTGGNLIDSIYIQVLPFTKKENVNKLSPSYSGDSKDLTIAISKYHAGASGQMFEGSVYGAKNVFGDGYLPRNNTWKVLQTPNGSESTVEISQNETTKVFDYPEKEEYTDNTFPYAIGVSNSSLIGNLATANPLTTTSVDPGKTEWTDNLDGTAREEVIDGKTYYVIPFEHKITDFKGDNLGFAFYTFLSVPEWVKSLDLLVGDMSLGTDYYTEFLEKFIIEGPINTETVFKDGKLKKTREAFFLPDGTSWEGSVHLHTSMNEAPDGYYGDGGLSIDTAAPPRGWMQGDTHHGSNQEKLRLVEVPNNKIVDFRYTTFEEPLFTALGFGGVSAEQGGKALPVLTDATRKITDFLVPFQKEKRRDFGVDHFGRPLDNEKEFSKLYSARSRKGINRSLFFINTEQLLRGQSNLFPLLFDKLGEMTDAQASKLAITHQDKILKILGKSRILSLKVFRDRVKKRVLNTRYENFANDEVYEEPSTLIGAYSDADGGALPLYEITDVKYFNQTKHRVFLMTDSSVSNKSAGLYRYRLELEFKDGTYEFLYNLYKDLSRAKVLLDTYYDLATSYYTDPLQKELNFDRTFVEKNSQYSKKTFKRYFVNGAFRQEFADLVEDPQATPQFAEYKPWTLVPALLNEIQEVFGLYPSGVNFKDAIFLNLLSPYPEGAGSPASIDLFGRFLKTAIYKIESLLSGTKVNKTGSELDNLGLPNSYSFNNVLSVVVSPADSTIREEHSFDHPSELFEAIDNKNIFSDYLGQSKVLTEGFFGLRNLSVEYYKQRCQLETAKFSPLAQMDEGFYGNDPNINIDWFSDKPDPQPTVKINDDLFKTGLSYLSPSTIRFKDTAIAGQTAGQDLMYKSFASNAVAYLNNQQSDASILHHPSFFDWNNYDSLFINLINSSLNRQENNDADLSVVASEYENPIFGESGNTIVKKLKEPFKRLFEDENITFHNLSNYDEFFGTPMLFDKTPGAKPFIQIDETGHIVPGQFLTEEGYHPDFPLTPDKYSDGGILPVRQFMKFAFNKKQNVIPLEPSTSRINKSWKLKAPNSFKLPFIQDQVNAGWKTKNVIHESINTPFTGTDEEYKYSSFLYFQLNLTARVEYFSGVTDGSLGFNPFENAKNDSRSWKLLEKSILESLVGSDTLFCRLTMYDERLNKKIRLPILDKYFLISLTGQPAAMPAIANLEVDIDQADTERTNDTIRDFDDGGAIFWQSRNYRKLEQFRTMTEKGMMRQGTPRVMPPYKEIYGPDPDPARNGAPAPGSDSAPGSAGGDIPFMPGPPGTPGTINPINPGAGAVPPGTSIGLGQTTLPGSTGDNVQDAPTQGPIGDTSDIY